MTTAGKWKHPIFNMYHLDELVDLLPYADYTLLDIRREKAKPSQRFRDTAVGILNKTELELFGAPELEPTTEIG